MEAEEFLRHRGWGATLHLLRDVEDYGKECYNKALEDASNKAVTIFDTGLINEIMLKGGSKIKYTDNDLIYKPSILKLKKL